MRILFICSKETDYLQDLTYAGLAALLGKRAIIDFPPHWQYHRRKKHFWSGVNDYPKNLGFTAENSPDEHNAAPAFQEIKESLRKNSFDLIMLGSCKPDALAALWKLQEWIRVPWIFIDGGDRPEIGGDFERERGVECLNSYRKLCSVRSPALIFKRELHRGVKADNLFPLPFSINPEKIPLLPCNGDKKYKVIFWAVESSPVRKEVFKLLKGKYDCGRNGSVAGQTFKKYSFRNEDYFRALNGSRIGLSFRGAGFDTLRYWEIPSCGSLLLSEKPDIEIPEDFSDRKNALFCRNDLSDLLELIDYYLLHEEEAREIALCGQKHLLQHHTHIHRAEYLLERVESILKIRPGL